MNSHPKRRTATSTEGPSPQMDPAAIVLAIVLRHAADLLAHRADSAATFTAGPALLTSVRAASDELVTATAMEVLRRHLSITQVMHYRADKHTTVEALRAAATEIPAPYAVLRADALAYRLQAIRDRLCTEANVSPSSRHTVEELTGHVINRLHHLEASLSSCSVELEQQRARVDAYIRQALNNPHSDTFRAIMTRAPEAAAGVLRAEIRHLEEQIVWLQAAAAQRAAIPILSRALHDAWPAIFTDGFEHDVARLIADRLRAEARKRYASARANGLKLPDLRDLMPDAA
jgi:hypothetical protein